jgi:hypothetical protein
MRQIEALKTAITSEPVLMPPRDDRPFIVKADGASMLGIGRGAVSGTGRGANKTREN